MGRPRVADEDRRDKPLRIRLTEAEREQIDRAAEMTEHNGSASWARDTLLKAAQRVIRANEREL